jgi:hypothetical protein
MLLFEPGVVVSSVPFHLREPEAPNDDLVSASATPPGA